MQSVPAPHLIPAPARRRGTRSVVLAALAVAVVLVSAPPLTTQHGSGPRSFAPKVALIGGLPMQQARCQQWLTATASEKNAALDTLHGVVGGPTSFGPATALTGGEATRLFDRTCARPWASNFLLYELYTRAAGFRSLVTH